MVHPRGVHLLYPPTRDLTLCHRVSLRIHFCMDIWQDSRAVALPSLRLHRVRSNSPVPVTASARVSLCRRVPRTHRLQCRRDEFPIPPQATWMPHPVHRSSPHHIQRGCLSQVFPAISKRHQSIFRAHTLCRIHSSCGYILPSIFSMYLYEG